MSAWDIANEFTAKAQAIPYPEMPQKPERGEMSASSYGRAVAKYEQAKDRARAGRLEYRVKQNECNEEFKAALARELGLAEHPKFDKLYNIAWEEGHSSGYSEVVNYADTLAELLRD